MQPMYEYRIIKEEINTQVAFPQNGLGDTMPDFAMVQPLEVITNYKVHVKGSFCFLARCEIVQVFAPCH